MVVDAAAMGFSLEAHEAHDIARLGVRITNAANAAIRFEHPENPDWQHFSFCLFAGPVTRDATGLRAGAAVAIQPGKVDRSPTGTALCARMALLHARGEMGLEDSLTTVSLIGSTFTGRKPRSLADARQRLACALRFRLITFQSEHELSINGESP